MKEKQKRRYRKAHIFLNIFRLIDDLQTFNNDEFENNYSDINCKELELKLTKVLVKPRFWTFQ